MIRLVSLIISMLVSFAAIAAETEPLTVKELQSIKKFYDRYYKAFPKDILYEDMLNFQLTLPDERASASKSVVDKIYDDHQIKTAAEVLVAKFGENDFRNESYNRLAEYLVDAYFTDSEHRAAIQLLIHTTTDLFFNADAMRIDYHKKTTFVPHFVKGATELAWVAAFGLTFIAGRGKISPGTYLKPKILRTGKAIDTKLAASLPGRILKATTYRPLGSVLKGVQNFFQKEGKYRTGIKYTTVNVSKNIASFSALVGFSGVAYGVPSWYLYSTGDFDKLNVTKTLDQTIFGLSALELSCQAVRLQQWAESTKLNDVKDSQLEKELIKKAKQINQMAEDFSVLADLAPAYLLSKALSKDINVKEGHVSDGRYNFDCPELSQADPNMDLTVNLQNTRNLIRGAVASLSEQLVKLKYGNAMNNLESVYGYANPGAVKGNESLMTQVGTFIDEDQKFSKMLKVIRNLSVTPTAPKINANFLEEAENSLNQSLISEESYAEIKKWAQQTLFGLNNKTYYGFMGIFFSQQFYSPERKASLIIFTMALEQQWQEVKSDAEMEFLKDIHISPMTLLAEYLGQTLNERGQIKREESAASVLESERIYEDE